MARIFCRSRWAAAIVVVAALSFRPGMSYGENTVELRFNASSEKKSWLGEVTRKFNAGASLTNGKKIHISVKDLSSDAVMDIATSRPQIVSPASSAYLTRADAKAGRALLTSKPRTLVTSPVVIAMWKNRAEALGWTPERPKVSWAEIIRIAADPDGWESKGHREWGKFKFGHTQPEFSNSGLLSVFSEVYAAVKQTSGKSATPTLQDLKNPAIQNFVRNIESSVVHYGESTGFFADELAKGGPDYLSAAVLYESSVVDFYTKKEKRLIPDHGTDLVAVYPTEGTFFSDHPIAVVAGVAPEQREAAEMYIDFLLAEEQQVAALRHGFRPGNEGIGFGAPLDHPHGVDTKAVRKELDFPSVALMEAMIDLWRSNKKSSHIVLVIDTSGSMAQGQRLVFAKDAARKFLDRLRPEDTLSVMYFSDFEKWVVQNEKMTPDRKAYVKNRIDSLYPEGRTALYQSTLRAYNFLNETVDENKIYAVVVLTDGEDTAGTLSAEDLISVTRWKKDARKGIRIFSIGYALGQGEAGVRAVLENLSKSSKAKSYDGDSNNIEGVFKDIFTFF